MEFAPLRIDGTARDRGRQQAALAPASVPAVRAAVTGRLEASRGLLERPAVRNYLERQRAFLDRAAPAQVEEVAGIAEGYGLSAQDLSAYLHLGIIDHAAAEIDGCSTYAASESAFGPFAAKNRDYGGAHRELQRVFVQSDPARSARRCIFVGSLGSPGAFSSGMNSAGLALVDTRVDWPKPGIGWLRYHLMTEILWRADTVDEAVAFIASVPHAGGGSLVLADASGAVASVEFGHPDAVIETRSGGRFVHTNHYVQGQAADGFGAPDTADRQDSQARLDTLRRASARHDARTGMAEIVALFSSHGDDQGGLCRHAADGGSATISTAIFCCQTRELHFFAGNPCESAARRITF